MLVPNDCARALSLHGAAVEQDLQGCLAVRRRTFLGPCRSLGLGPYGVPSEGGRFLMSEVPLYFRALSPYGAAVEQDLQGYLAHEPPPPRTTSGP